MFSAESAVSNVSSSNVATALPDLTASAVGLSGGTKLSNTRFVR